MSSAAPVDFRTRTGRVGTALVGLACLALLVWTALEDPGAALRTAPALALLPALGWLLFVRPAVVVDDAGVELRNVLRTVHVPWAAIRRVDTKYALTLSTASGDFAAWAAPAPSRRSVLDAGPGDVSHLPGTTYLGGGARPGDLLTSASGEAAAYIRRRSEELREAGALDDPRAPSAVVTRWHPVPALAVAVLAAAAVVGVRLL